ncbi:uncharacterized protein sfi1 [Aplochiton taeniatus]
MPVKRQNASHKSISRAGKVNFGAGAKHAGSSTRKVVYKVGYTSNKGGRLKELRIRHLARKFLNIWILRTFGRIHPYTARSFHCRRVLQPAFQGWREEWWVARREWSLTVRADCHYRYYLYTLAFHSWRQFVSLKREKKNKLGKALCFAGAQSMRLNWSNWEVFLKMKRMKGRMLESALEHKRLAALRSSWNLWQTKLQQQHNLCLLEEHALQHWALSLQSRAWLQWRELYVTACSQREREAKASVHYVQGLKIKALGGWISYVHCRRAKKMPQAVAVHAYHLKLVSEFWTKWRSGLQSKQGQLDRRQAAESLAEKNRQRRALGRWRNYVEQCTEESEKMCVASQHRHRHLLHAGLQGLMVNVSQSKTQRMNKILSVQQYEQALTKRNWRLWQQRLEETEDKTLQPQMEMALTHYGTSLLTNLLHLWKEKLAERRRTKELEHRLDVFLAGRILPQCLSSWMEVTLERRQHKDQGRRAEFHNRQRQYIWAFYTWWGRSEERKEQKLSERMAVLHEERLRVQRVWAHWKQRTEHQIQEREKQKASDTLYTQTLLEKTLKKWKDLISETRDRKNKEEQAFHHGDLCIMRCAIKGWKEYVKDRRSLGSRMEQMDRYHEDKVLKGTFQAWKEHHHQTQQIYGHVEERYSVQQQHSLSRAFGAMKQQGALLLRLRTCRLYFQRWTAELQCRRREGEQTELALWHWSLSLQAKVLDAWKAWVTERHRKQERLAKAGHFYRDQLLREGVTHILTHTAHMSSLTASLAQRSQEQQSQRLLGVVLRCAMHWKRRALFEPGKGREVKARKKNVTFCLPAPASQDVHDRPAAPTGPVEQGAGDIALDQVLLLRSSRVQPRRPKDLLESPVREVLHSRTFPPSPATSIMLIHSAGTRVCDRESGEKTEDFVQVECDSTVAMRRELLNIRLDMQRFQHDRKQLQAWRRLKEVFENWLQTSGTEELAEEKNTISQDLAELEISIRKLSAELAQQKPTMLVHAAKVQHIETFLHTNAFVDRPPELNTFL